jgi:hypothetical protein
MRARSRRDNGASRSDTVNLNFSHMIFVRSDDPRALVELLEQWDLQQASADIMGYMGARLLADRENAGQYIIAADFGVIDPDVSAADEATRNDDRPETRDWAARLRAVIEDDPRHHNYDELYRTDFGVFDRRAT